ncbi:MAG: UPF0280 family protein [Myxococcales bacterium]|nr:UPF0280 family protein [Myxococcales bacterium]
MTKTRHVRTFSWKTTHLRVMSQHYDAVTQAVVQHRRQLEAYIKRHRDFADALAPLPLRDDAPEVVRRMADASRRTGVGPMAAVAGALAQLGVETATALGERDVFVDNGGDMFLHLESPLPVGIYAGPKHPAFAFDVQPAQTPLAICASSGHMGRSFSRGNCDLACVLAEDAALADAAATMLANRIHSVHDLKPATREAMRIPGIIGVLATTGQRTALAGTLPEFIRADDLDTLLSPVTGQ